MTTKTIPMTLAERAIAFWEDKVAAEEYEETARRVAYIEEREVRFVAEVKEILGTAQCPPYNRILMETGSPDRPEVSFRFQYEGIPFVYITQYLRAVKDCPACGGEIYSTALCAPRLLVTLGAFLRSGNAEREHFCPPPPEEMEMAEQPQEVIAALLAALKNYVADCESRHMPMTSLEHEAREAIAKAEGTS